MTHPSLEAVVALVEKWRERSQAAEEAYRKTAFTMNPDWAAQARSEVFDFCADELESALRSLACVESGGGGEWRPMETAPKGQMLRLLVEFTEHPTEDATVAPTIGAYAGDEELGWQFAGWCWTHDHFTQGEGKPIGWLPMLDTALRASEGAGGGKPAMPRYSVVNMHDPFPPKDSRIVGFRIPLSDPMCTDSALLPPLDWFRSLFATPPAAQAVAGLSEGERPVAWRFRSGGGWYGIQTPCATFNHNSIEHIAHPDPRIEYAYAHPAPASAAVVPSALEILAARRIKWAEYGLSEEEMKARAMDTHMDIAALGPTP